RREREGTAGAGTLAHRSAAARSQLPWARDGPGPRRHRTGSAVGQAHASGRRDHLHPRRLGRKGRAAPHTDRVTPVPSGTIILCSLRLAEGGAEMIGVVEMMGPEPTTP